MRIETFIITNRGEANLKQLGCLHAHHSNINYIERAFQNYDLDLVHFVDPVLISRITNDHTFNRTDAQKKVREQLEWIAASGVDAILITCTNYIAILDEVSLSMPIPIIKIDEPYIRKICTINKAHLIVFTNPATVEGTMNRLQKISSQMGRDATASAYVIGNTFELIMKGLKNEYNAAIINCLNKLAGTTDNVISVAQLSMVDAVNEFEKKGNIRFMNPLDTLVETCVHMLDLKVN